MPSGEQNAALVAGFLSELEKISGDRKRRGANLAGALGALGASGLAFGGGVLLGRRLLGQGAKSTLPALRKSVAEARAKSVGPVYKTELQDKPGFRPPQKKRDPFTGEINKFAAKRKMDARRRRLREAALTAAEIGGSVALLSSPYLALKVLRKMSPYRAVRIRGKAAPLWESDLSGIPKNLKEIYDPKSGELYPNDFKTENRFILKSATIRAFIDEKQKIARVLSAKGRKQIDESNFALPGRRYPIHDAAHARNALARVSQFGTPEEKAAVRAAVARKYPDMGKEKTGGSIYRPSERSTEDLKKLDEKLKRLLDNPRGPTAYERKTSVKMTVPLATVLGGLIGLRKGQNPLVSAAAGGLAGGATAGLTAPTYWGTKGGRHMMRHRIKKELERRGELQKTSEDRRPSPQEVLELGRKWEKEGKSMQTVGLGSAGVGAVGAGLAGPGRVRKASKAALLFGLPTWLLGYSGTRSGRGYQLAARQAMGKRGPMRDDDAMGASPSAYREALRALQKMEDAESGGGKG